MHTTIRKIFTDIFPYHLRILAKELRHRLRNKYYNVHTISNNQGFALIYQCKNVYHLDYLGVDPTTQGKGLGKQLLLELTQRYPKMSLECESHLVPFYTKFGFNEVAKIEYRWNNHILHLMVRGLSDLQSLLYAQTLIKKLACSSIEEDFMKKDLWSFFKYKLTSSFFFKHHAWNE
jgi:GNAT superfamily N-acetyltransferase